MEIVHRLGCCFVPAHVHYQALGRIPPEARTKSTMNVVFVFGRPVYLGPCEYLILHFLMRHPEDFWVTRNMLLDCLGDAGEIDDRSIDALIKRLRRKLFPENRDLGSIFIQTGYGLGFRIPSRKQLEAKFQAQKRHAGP
jgi:DNA-binding response OmpR family regulator